LYVFAVGIFNYLTWFTFSDGPKNLASALNKLTAALGESYTFSIIFSAVPEPWKNMTCKKGDSSVVPEFKMESLGGDIFVSYVTFNNVQSSDYGIYICQISNGIEMPLNIELTVAMEGEYIISYNMFFYNILNNGTCKV
jgi:hypothetical protein